MDLLREEYEGMDAEARVRAAKRIDVIAKSIGPEKTRSELIPFLLQNIETDDEILLETANQLGKFTDYIGGKDHVMVVMELLEQLAAVEETVVRDAAVKSIGQILEGFGDGEAPAGTSLLPIFQRLATGDWFTSRVSAAGVARHVYAHIAVVEERREARVLFSQLCKDDTPMVRRSAASNLGGVAVAIDKVSENQLLVADLVPLFASLSTDDQDSVRLLAIGSCPDICKVMAKANMVQEMLSTVMSVIKTASDDLSWRVRHQLGKCMGELMEAVGKDLATSEVLPILTHLMQDHEAEVRASCVKSLPKCSTLITNEIALEHIIPLLPQLAGDGMHNVRTNLAKALMAMAPQWGNDISSQHLAPLLLEFLRDEACEVQLNVLQELPSYPALVKLMNPNLTPLLKELSTDVNWRVRQGVVQSMGLLADALGADSFQSQLLSVFLAAFEDRVSAVRERATTTLVGMMNALGGDWLLDNIVPALRSLFESSSYYLVRITVIEAFSFLCGEKMTQLLGEEVVRILCMAAGDAVPNVRFTAAQALGKVSVNLDDGTVQSQIRPKLTELINNDQDEDVKFYAGRALEACG